MYGVEKSMDMMKKLKGLIHKLIQQYVLKPFLVLVAIQPILVHLASNMASQHNDDKGDKSDDWDAEFKMKMKKKQGEVQKKKELDRYLEDDVKDDHAEFDILNWWKLKAFKYYILSCMARDIPAIPVFTVSSESAFSTGGRILDLFHSSLSPTTVEALICAQNWLRSTN